MTAPALEVRGLQKRFGAVVAAADISIDINQREIVGLIGTNGAGKTTFVNMVTGYVQATGGAMRLFGENILGLAPERIVALGVARSFQVPQLFASKTPREHLMLALALAERAGARRLFGAFRQPERAAEADDYLKSFSLESVADQPVIVLPQGVRKLLDIAMAMCLRPKLLFLDEPTSGVASEEKFALMDLVMRRVVEREMTVLFVEHDMEIVSRHVTRVLAFQEGRVIADGGVADVLNDGAVMTAVTGAAHRPAATSD